MAQQKSLIELLSEVVKNGKREVEKILLIPVMNGTMKIYENFKKKTIRGSPRVSDSKR